MTKSTERGKLANIELFRGLPLEDLKAVEEQARFWRFPTGEQIIDRNSDNQEVYFVINGSVRVVNFSSSGREIAFAHFLPGNFFGEIAAIDGKPRSANVFAATNCELASISPAAFRELLTKHPSISGLVLERFAEIIRIADERIMDLSTLRVVQRVYIELLRLTDRDAAVPDMWVIRPMVSHNDIASQVGTTRETVARVIGQLTAAKVVERKSKALYIRDKPRLERLAKTTSPEGMVAPKPET